MNYKIYFISSFLISVILLPVLGIGEVFLVYLGLYFVIIFFFFLLFYFGRILFKMADSSRVSKKDMIKALIVILGKNLAMMAAVYWGYTRIEKKIIGIVGLYFLQMLLMYVSIKYNKTNE